MSDSVIPRVEGTAGRLTLNRPQALNALTLDMIRAMRAALEGWLADDAVKLVILDGAGGRALCAGGDIRALYDSRAEGDGFAATFWREEYALDVLIAEYPKPFVSVMDGIVMGGGVGIAAHAAHRVVTERTKFAMPEVGIGFAPDVGGTWLLSRAPGETGTSLALTGRPVGAADCLFAGFADAFLPSAAVAELLPALCRAADAREVKALLARFARHAGASDLAARRAEIDAAFGRDTVEAIGAALAASGAGWAAEAIDAMAAKSPASLKVALASLRRARRLRNLRECLDLEYRMALRLFAAHDFIEGIRALVIDKDQKPAWRPADLAAIETDAVEAYFAPLGARELGLAAAP